MDQRAQYAIEIAAQMTGGATTVDQLGEMSSVLLTGGKDAAFFAEAMSTVNAQLKDASAVSATASGALKLATEEYNLLETAALSAAKAAEKAALSNGGLIPAELFAESEKAQRALASQAVALKALEDSARLAKAEELRLIDVQRNLANVQGLVNKSFATTAANVGKMKAVIAPLGDALGGTAGNVLVQVDAFQKLSAAFGVTRAAAVFLTAALAGFAVAVAATVLAAIAGVASITRWGVSLADSARNAQLATEAFQAAHPELDTYAEAAERAAAASGLNSAALQALTVKLEAAKVAADDLPEALEAAAIAERALGSNGADKFIEAIKSGKRSVLDLAKTTREQFGGVVARQLMSLDSQAVRFKANVERTFGGLRIDPLLDNLDQVGRLFDKNTESGAALKAVFEGLVQPLVDGFSNTLPAIESFFLGIEIGVLKALIALKPVGRALKEIFGFEDQSTEDTLAAVAKAGEYLAYVGVAIAASFTALAVIVVPLLTVALGGVVLALGAVGAAVIATVAAGYYVAQGLTETFNATAEGAQWLWRTIGELFDAGLAKLTEFAPRTVQLGKELIAGLAQGILSGASAVVDALTGAVRSAVDGAKKVLGIASPSKVFARIGEDTVSGYAQGVDAKSNVAHESLQHAVMPATLKTDVSAAGSLQSVDRSNPTNQRTTNVDQSTTSSNVRTESSANTTTIKDNHFHFHGVEGAEDAEHRVRDLFAKILTGELDRSGGVA